ncbi:MAG: carboxypeptidase-like regulatory domain-containing protein, partial [Parabacteroides sp.]|nr:carboxypeptidase-like regulatory domain-containing protein [Parabacteroides sp.]
MKISLILCLMALQITASNVYSQYVNLKLSVKNTTVAAVISSITHQTGYEFSYDAELLNKQIKNVSVSAKNERIENVLTELFKDTGIGFKILDNRVFLIENFEKNKTSENKTAEVQQKQKTVTGTILDQSGVPVIGANVVVKGSSVGTITDLDGNFTLNNVPDGASLLVSYIGFLEQTILVTNKTSFNITLKEDTQKLDEV